MTYEYTTGGKWLEFLKEIAPNLSHAAVLRDTGTPTGMGLFGAIQAAGSSLRIEAKPVNVRDAHEIERVIAATGELSNGGLIDRNLFRRVSDKSNALQRRLTNSFFAAAPH